MTAKRYSHDGITIIDHLKKDLIYIDGKENLLELAEYVDKLQEENKQLKQFKEDVFYKIDMHLRMLPTARDNKFNEENGDPSLYTGAIYMLETLKKELENE